jgi:hypothetical protein
VKELMENWNKFINEIKNAPEKKLSSHEEQAAEAIANTLSAEDTFRDDAIALLEGEELPSPDVEYEKSDASNPDEEVVKRFFVSLNSGKRSGFLTYYKKDELKEMNLFLIKGHNAGFAIKKDGDIVSVHNNSSLRGLASRFLSDAKNNGGTKLDHFDGFLSGLYRRYGFNDVYEVYQWDEQYSPKQWTYESVDILNSKTSIYAEATANVEDVEYNMKELKQANEQLEVKAEDGFKIEINPSEKFNQYKYGRPDVIFRRL